MRSSHAIIVINSTVIGSLTRIPILLENLLAVVYFVVTVLLMTVTNFFITVLVKIMGLRG